ncbi:core protein precursor pX [unidentified adenovirus]|uniref:Core protein pX n=1 Tax=Chinstrap penguin adenovirus 2 TaxID=1434088 RepID=A0A162HSI2_9ADEN|nr:core protein precursor pX [Chinstrap penguin adenovirus 2]ALB78144.1 core protein precursor pX [Chinstrap penguin adenovirus 2]ALB78166.1 core protein precursor pX [unidentified adenovirus]ALB78188.1 core protein precursor pX [unidentified adenovirus]ALB78210.1 core protein precursor pX [unidentified adenovirus]
MFENLAPRRGLSTKMKAVHFNREMRGGFIASLIPIISSLITAAPAIASTVIAARNSK